MVTTDLTSPFDEHAETIHRGCEEARVPYIRYGAWARLDGAAYLDSLQAARAGLRGLETLCRRHNLRALVRQLPGSLQEQSGHAATLLHGRLPGYGWACAWRRRGRSHRPRSLAAGPGRAGRTRTGPQRHKLGDRARIRRLVANAGHSDGWPWPTGRGCWMT